jgi:signal peptidase I
MVDQTASPASQTVPSIEHSLAYELWSFVKSLLLILILAVVIRGVALEAFYIPSSSMEPTLQVRDRIFVSKFWYGFRIPFKRTTLIPYRNPRRRDVVVFYRADDPHTLENEAKDAIIKRVIGLPGDIVEVRGTSVIVNGEPLVEPYARWAEGGRIPGGDFGPQTVPEGRIFLLGDNRDHSKDSRFWGDSHFLPIENVVGRAFVIFWSTFDFWRIGNLL